MLDYESETVVSEHWPQKLKDVSEHWPQKLKDVSEQKSVHSKI
jgi:hypothetical protein